MRTKKTTLSFLTESKTSAVGLSSMRRVAMTLLVMLLTTASAIAQNYWLTLDPNCDDVMGTTIPIPSYDPTYKLSENVKPTREGYLFCGWAETPTGDIKYVTGDVVTLSGNLTLYAIWDKTYTLTLDDNYEGGASTMVSVSIIANTITLTKNFEPTRTGYTFYGWSKSPTGTVEYRTNYKITLGGNLTLYAVWDALKYTITDEGKKQVEVSNCNTLEETLNIPATVTINGIEYSVTSIGEKAFENCDNLQSVTIPNSVTSIGNSAFQDCSNLQYVTIPESVTSIGNYAFFDCSSLQSVTIPNSVTSIGESAFEVCSNLQSVTINGNPKIGEGAFGGILALANDVTMNLTASKIDGDYWTWTTFYNDGYYNFLADKYTTVYKGTVNESSLMLTEVEDKIVNSGTAVILKSLHNPVMTLTVIGSSDTNGNDLRGISDRDLRTSIISNFSANEIYTMGNTSAGFGFHRYTGEFVPAGKAFLPLNIENGAKPILNIVFANETTGINSLSSDSNVQNDWFSLDGTRLNGKPSQPGIYVNGKKKVVIK